MPSSRENMATIANLTSSTPESDRNLSTPQQLQMELLPDGPELSRLASAELRKLGFRVPKLKLTKTKSTKQAPGSVSKMFGVAVQEQEVVLSKDSGLLVPRFLDMASRFLVQHSTTEGLFRRSGSVVRQRNLRNSLERGGSLEGNLVHDVASLLKQWFRDLPEPLFPKTLQPLLLRCQREAGVEALLLAVLLVPKERLCVLRHLVLLLNVVANSSAYSLMDARNLSLMLAPNLFHGSCPLSGQELVVQLLIENASRVGVPPSAFLGASSASRKKSTALLNNLRCLVPQRKASPLLEPTLPDGQITPKAAISLDLVDLECSPGVALKRSGEPPLFAQQGPSPCKRAKQHESNSSLPSTCKVSGNCHEGTSQQDLEATASITVSSPMLLSPVIERPDANLDEPKSRENRRSSGGGGTNRGSESLRVQTPARASGRAPRLQRVATWNAAGNLWRGRPNTVHTGLPSPLRLNPRVRPPRRSASSAAGSDYRGEGRTRVLEYDDDDDTKEVGATPHINLSQTSDVPMELDTPGEVAEDTSEDTPGKENGAQAVVPAEASPCKDSENCVETASVVQQEVWRNPWTALPPTPTPSDASNKRESIAQMRRLNAGRVRSTVQYFDHQLFCTPVRRPPQRKPSSSAKNANCDVARSPLREANFRTPIAADAVANPSSASRNWRTEEPLEWEMAL